MRDGPLYGIVVEMIKETIPKLQKLSTADKFALAVELWDELSSNSDEMPVPTRFCLPLNASPLKPGKAKLIVDLIRRNCLGIHVVNS